VADDTEAFKNAVNFVSSAGGGSVFVPGGNSYLLTTAGQGIILPNGVDVIGANWTSKIVVNNDSTNTGVFQPQGNNRILNLQLQGPHGTSAVSAVKSNQIAINNKNTTRTLKIEDIIIRDCYIHGWADGHIWITNPIRCNVVRNRLEHAGHFACFFVGGANSNFLFNYVNDVSPGAGGNFPFTNAYGISFTNDVSTPSWPAPLRHKCVGNIFKNVITWESMDTHGGQDCIFDGNHCQNSLIGIFIGPSSGVNNTISVGCHVTNNSFKATSAMTYVRAGILLAPGVNGADHIIKGNTITGYGSNPEFFAHANGGALEGAIHAINARNFIINDNVIKSSNMAGITLRQNLLGGMVAGNIIENIEKTSTIHSGIYVEHAESVTCHIGPLSVARTSGTKIESGVRLDGSAPTGTAGVTLSNSLRVKSVTNKLHANTIDKLKQNSEILYAPIANGFINNNGSIATIVHSSNIASATRTGKGLVSIVFKKALPNKNYIVNLTTPSGSAMHATFNTQVSTGFQIITWDGTGKLKDKAVNFVVFYAGGL